MTERDQQLDRYLQENLENYIQETATLCAQPSISATGEGVESCAELVAALLEQRNFRVERVETPGNPVIVGHLSGASHRTLLCYNHYDVQPPEPLELWTTPPFEPTLRGGALYARGAKDDKGELVARLAAFDAVRAVYGEPPCSLLFVVEGEEEIGSPHMPQFVEDNRERLQCHGAIWETGGTTIDGHPELWLGCRGVLAVELSVETLSKDAHSGSAHILPNAAWRLTRALSSLKDANDRIRIAGFYDQAVALSEADRRHLATLPDMEKRLREVYGVEEFVRGLSGADLRSAVFEPTCNIQGLQSGYTGQGMKTVIPAVARVKLDFRLVPWQDPDDILDKLRAHLDREGFHDVVISKLGAMWPYKADDNDPLVALVRQSGEEVYGKASVVTPLLGGSSPVYAFHRPLNIPVVSAGIGYGMENRLHAPDEHIRIDDFLQGCRHISRIMARFDTLS